MRERASKLATEWLGSRTELEIQQSLRREVDQERWTTLDRMLQREAQGGLIHVNQPRLGHVPLNETADLRQLKKNAADEVERRVLESLQEQTNGDVRAMAAALNLTQRAIYQKLSHHGLGTAREAKS